MKIKTAHQKEIMYRRFAPSDGPDFYSTPAWATLALLELEEFEGNISEPACGDGVMSEMLKTTGLPVLSSDLHYRGYVGSFISDFLTSSQRADNIVTNPPFNLAEKFVVQAIKLSKNKVCMFLRLAFLESSGRAKRLYSNSKTRPSRVYVFSERVTFDPEGRGKDTSGTMAFAWFVWDKTESYGYNAPTTTLHWIEPGTRSRCMIKALNLTNRKKFRIKRKKSEFFPVKTLK